MQKRSVFYDRKILVGAEWARILEKELQQTRCMIVLWSKSSVNSFWVRAEAAEGLERDILIPVQLDQASLPRLYQHLQTALLLDDFEKSNFSLEPFLDLIEERVGSPAFQGLEYVPLDGAITPECLALIHSSWRRSDKDAEWKRPMYQIHVIVFGKNKSSIESIS